MWSRGGVGPQPTLEHHESHLGNRGEGEGPFDARLREHHDPTKQGSDRPDCRQEIEREMGERDQRTQPDHEKATGVDDSRVHQGRDGSGCLHRVGQPAVEGHLSRLCHRADNEAEANRGAPPAQPLRIEVVGLGKDGRVVGAPEAPEGEGERGEKKRIAEPAHEEFLSGRPDRPGTIGILEE